MQQTKCRNFIMKNKKLQKYGPLTLQIILALLFLLAGAGKFLAAGLWIEKFNRWNYPDNFYLVVGLTEVVCAVLLFIPKLSKYAAIIMLGIMISATLTLIIHDELRAIIQPVIYMVLVAVLILLKRKKIGSTVIN